MIGVVSVEREGCELRADKLGYVGWRVIASEVWFVGSVQEGERSGNCRSLEL